MDDHDIRIVELEIKLSFQDQLVSQLDRAVRELGDRVIALGDEVMRLRGEVTRMAEEGQEPASSLLDEKPPHY